MFKRKLSYILLGVFLVFSHIGYAKDPTLPTPALSSFFEVVEFAPTLDGLDKAFDINQMIYYFRKHPIYPSRILVLNYLLDSSPINTDLLMINRKEDTALVDFFHGKGRQYTAWRINSKEEEKEHENAIAHYVPPHSINNPFFKGFNPNGAIVLGKNAIKQSVLHEFFHKVFQHNASFKQVLSIDEQLIHPKFIMIRKRVKLMKNAQTASDNLNKAVAKGEATNAQGFNFLHTNLLYEDQKYKVKRRKYGEEAVIWKATYELSSTAGIPLEDIRHSAYMFWKYLDRIHDSIDKVMNDKNTDLILTNREALSRFLPKTLELFKKFKTLTEEDLREINKHYMWATEEMLKLDIFEGVKIMIDKGRFKANESIMNKMIKKRLDTLILAAIEKKLVQVTQELVRKFQENEMHAVIQILIEMGILEVDEGK